MTPKEKDIANMKCWVFRMAQVKWKKKPKDCVRIFSDYGLFNYIDEAYDYLHLNGYKLVLNDIEGILKDKGVTLDD